MPNVQGAVLAELLSIWLAGFRAPSDAHALLKFRDTLLHLHIDTVWRLVGEADRRCRAGGAA